MGSKSDKSLISRRVSRVNRKLRLLLTLLTLLTLRETIVPPLTIQADLV